jgi:histidinol phosphatase-like enzyme (inositol monophosphatase family)
MMEVALRAARTGGGVALHHFRRGVTARRKPDGSPVTDADLAAEEAIRSVLETATPGVPILGEEMGGADPESAPEGDRWIVDPIDGTRNFVRRIPIFASLVALESDGQCVVGAAFAPAMDEAVVAGRGEGCRWNDQPVRVSDVTRPDRSLVVFGGLEGFLKPPRRDGFLHLVASSERLRGFGDYYGHLLVATGRAEVMVETGIHPWDVAAMQVIVEEAGGRFTDLEGRRTIYSGTAVATNGLLHESILGILNRPPGARKVD